MKQENKLNYDDLTWIVNGLTQLEQYWIEKKNACNDADTIDLYSDIIKHIQATEKKVRNKDCF